MVSKARREHLKRARSLAQQRREELRIEALVQGHEDALLEIVGNDQGEEGDEREEEVEEQTDQTFYWDSSATETDTESEPDVESELNNETESLPTNEQSRSASGTFGQLPLRWNQDAGKNLRGAYGSGSRSTHKRERRKAKALECEAKKSCNIVAVFGRQRELNLSLSPTVQENSMPTTLPMQSAPLSMVPRGGPALQPVSKKEELRAALEDLKHLLRRVSDQEKKYGEQLNINGNFYLRHTSF